MQHNYPDDASFFKAIQKRDDAAYTLLREKCFVGVKAMVKASKGSDEVAEDIYIEGIERLIKTLDEKGKDFTGNVFHLFIRICRNHWLDVLKTKSDESKQIILIDDTVAELADEDVAVDPIAIQLEEALFDDFIWKSFKQLKKDCQKILRYAILERKKFKEIANLMELTVQYARKKKYLCKEALIEIASKHPEYSNYC